MDPPHDQLITSLAFQPNKRHSTSSGSGSRPVLINAHRVYYMVATTSMDGKFKTWVLVDDEEMENKEKDKDSPPSWACRSDGYYHSLPCLGGVFCQDGSLLALNFKKVNIMLALFFDRTVENMSLVLYLCVHDMILL